MVGELVTLPLRVGTRVTRLWFRAIEETASLTVGATGRVIELLASRSANGAGVDSPPREPRSPTPPSPPTPRQSPPTTARTPAAPEPVHVTEEPILVEEFAEPGAEQGAGAEVHVEPPWDDYGRMTAAQVITRLATADPAELAAVQLYEGSNRRRRTVINAVERELRGRSH